MNKNIWTIFSADKAVSLRVIEPFHIANHFLLLVDHLQNLPAAENLENAVTVLEVAPRTESESAACSPPDKSAFEY